MGKVLSPEEFEKNYKGTLTKPYSSGGIGTGDILPRDFGKSQLDSRATASDIDNLNDFRAENQPLSERWKNGVSKALINVPIRVADGLVTSTAAVLGGLGELGDAFIPGDNVKFSDFINNPISQAFDGLSRDLQENMPVYRSDEYEDAGFVGKAFGEGSSAFWADTMTDAASFMGASLIGGMGVAKGLGGLTKQALKLSKAKSILGELEAAGNLGSLTNKSELIKSIVASTYGGAAESGVEARQTYQDLLAKGATEEEASSASNISFLINMVLTGGANFAQFGKIFSKTIDESLDASRLISEGGKLKISELSKTQKAYNMLLNNGSDIVTEGGQEASQFITSKFLENYYTGDDETRDDFFKSMVNAVSELKSSEGIESVLAGAVLGGLSTAGKKFAQRGQKSTEDTKLQEAVDNYNSYNIADIFTEDTKVLAGQFSRNLQADAAIKQAVRNNDEFGADLIKATSFGDQVVTNLRVGKFEDLIEQLTDVKNSNVDETNELFKSESYNKFTEDEKNAIAETAIEQAYKIKKSYEDNMIKYGKVISHEDIAKMSINESVLDFAKNKEQEVYEGLKPLIDIKGEILSTYKSPKEIDELRSKNDLLTSTISSIKSDIKAKGKDYKGERDADLELAINNSNDILKTIENSITDYEGSGQVSYKDKDGKEQIKDYNIDYKKTVVKEVNKRLNNLKAAAERGAGDITEWQKYNKLLKDYVKLQKIKEDIIDARNKYAVDPAGYFAKVNSNIEKIKESKSLKQLFTTKSQPYKNEQGFVDKDSTEDLTIEKGLYYTRLGRQIYQKDSKGQRKLDNGKPVLTNLVQNRRKFIEVVDTFAKVNPDTNRTEGWVKIKEGDTTKEIPVSSLNGQLNRAKYISGEGVETVDKMTEEEAFYYNYKDRIIQYQYRSTFSEPAKIIEGQLAYNYRGDLVVRYFDDKGYPKYTHALYSKDGKPVGASFEVFNNSDKGKFRLENSQYLKIYSEEESKKIKELIALKDRKRYYENKLEKLLGGNKSLQNKKADIERRRQEELNQQTDAGYSTIALDYLFTGGRDVMLSTDYLLQALVGGFTSAAKEINDIRNKYANKLGNIRDDINSDVYNQMMGEIRNVISKTYNDSKANEIFDKILKNATGFTNREGNQISIELDKLNEQNESKINAKYDAELKALEEQTETKPEETVSTTSEIKAKKADIERRRQEELESYAYDIVEKVEDYEVIDDNVDILFVQIRYKKDGSKEVLTGIEKNKYGNVAKGGNTVIGDTFYTDIYEKVTKIGERTAEEANLSGRKDKINAKYDAELKESEEKIIINSSSFESTKLPHEDIMLQESEEIKQELKSLKDKYNQVADKRTSPAKRLKKTIEILDKKLSSIDNYAESLQKEKAKYTKFVENLDKLIEKNKVGDKVEYNEEREILMNRIQAERGKYSTYIKELTDSDEAFKQNKALYYEVLKELRQQYDDIINPDLLYDSEYFAEVIDAMPEYGIDLRFRNRELSTKDFQEIVNFVIEGNGDTVQSYNEDTQELKEVKLDVKQLDGVGNEDYSAKIERLDNIISNINTEATKALAKVRSSNRKEFSTEDTINSYDFYNDLINSIKRVERELSKDDSIFVPRTNLKISGYDDVFIGSDGNGIVISDKKTAEQGLTTTSPNINENFAGFPSNSSNENDKHQWVYQKFLNDNDVTDYYVEYKISDKVGTFTRDKSFDSDRTQKAIIAQIVNKDGTELKLNSWGQEDANGAYLPITVLEAGSGRYRPVNSKGISPAKYRETEEADLLREKLKTATEKAEIDSLTEQIEALDKVVDSNLNKIQEERERILTVLESGKRFVSPIVGQSLGVKIPADDNEISKVLGTDYKEKIRDGKLKVVVVKDPEITIGSRKISPKIGSVIIHETSGNNPRIYFLKGRKLEMGDFFKITEEIKKFADNEVNKVFTSDFRGFYNKIRSYVYWGSNNDINKQYDGKTLDETVNETEESAKQKLYSLRFKFGSNSQIVEYGNYIGKDDKGKPMYENKEISISEIQSNQDFQEFITSKYKHFSSSLLSDYMIENIMTPAKSPLGVILDKNFTINLQPKSNVQFQSQYITPSNEQVTKFAEVAKKEVKQTTGTSSSNDIDFIEPSLRLSDSLSYDEAIKQIQVWTEEGYLNKFQDFNLDKIYESNVASAIEAQNKGESLTSDKFAIDILGIENISTSNGEDTTYTTKREFKSTAALNVFLQSLIKRFPDIVGNKKVTTIEQAVESNNIDDIFGTEAGDGDIDSNSASSLFEEDGSFMRYSKILESQPKIRLSDLGINDFKNYFGVPFKVVDRLTKGIGFGVVRQTVDDLSSIAYNIEVEENAPLGTEYHEKFHLIERAIFNDRERKQIYNLYRKTTKSTVTDAEASELLAEEFRYYSIERVAKDKRLNGTALEKVLAFIENFIKGISELFSYKNSETMNKLFDMMYNDTIKTATGKTIEQALSFKEVSTRLTSEEIRATQKFALLEYYKAFEKSVPNFNYIDFIINKDYNKKAKQTYARLNNFDVDNEVDGDNLVINHIIASMRIENPLLNAKFKDINNRKQFIEEFKAYFASVNKESLIAEDLLEDEFNSEDSLGGRGDAFETDPTSKNHIQGTPSFVKQLLNTIPGDTNYLGLQEHVDSNKLNIELVYLFEKADSSVEMNNLLRESGRREFLALADRLQGKSEASSTDKNYRELRISKLNSFYSSLRKQILSFTQVDVEDEGKVTIIDKNRNTLIEKSLYDFKNNFKASFPATTEVELAKELQGIESTTEYNFINKLGFTVDRRFINFLADNNLLTKFNETVSKIRQRDFKDKKAVEKLLKDPTKLTNIRIIAELISNYKSDLIPVQVLSTDNKPMYAIIDRSFLSKKHNELVKKFKDAPIGSLESKIAKSKIIYNLGISSSEETQKSSKMTEKPSFIFHIANALDKEISPYINTGDKSSYFGFQGLASIVPGDVEITNEHYVEVFKEFFRQEFETFSKFKSADEGKVMPKMKKFFAVAQDILLEHRLEKLVFDKELKYTDFDSLYSFVEREFEEGVKLEAEKANRKLKQSLIDNGIVTYDGKFNFIDNGSLSRRLITNPDQLVERLNLFFWESNMLQSKFIVGDIGIYGLDLAKRVPAGMATKTDGNYSPAVAKLLDTELKYSTNNIMFNKTDAKGELIFDALVIDDLYHNDEVLGELFKNYKETNLSDAMGFEHIDSIRFREIAEGTWTEEDIKIYQLDLEGKANLEDMHKWTMKKTQYFGSQLIDFSKDSEETMEVNTFYKMAVLPISRTLVSQSGSKTLRGIKKLMENNNVPLMMFDSANKISRKEGYKLFDSKGNVNQGVPNIPNKTINVYWGQAETEYSTRILSNLALRPFSIDVNKVLNNKQLFENKIKFKSVEQAYQSLKSGEFDKSTYDKYEKVGGYGQKIRGKSANNSITLDLMKNLVVESFRQNPSSEAADKLLQYSTFTHNTDAVIDRAFLEGLYLAQEELINTKPANIDKYKQTSYWKYYNTQQETHKKSKSQQTLGTQFSKQIFANILEGEGNLTVNSSISTKFDVLLPIGTSGSGKSTFIKSLSQENLIIIEPDAMRVEFTGDINDKSKDKEIYIEASTRAINALKQGKQIVFDTTNLTKDKRLSFIEAIKRQIPNANIQYKLMELNPELAKQRIKIQIARRENRANVSDSTIDRHAESYKQMLEDIKNEPLIEYKSLSNTLVKASDVINNIDYLHTERVDVTKKLLLDRLGVTEEKGGYKVASKEKLFKELKSNLDQKDVSIALKQEIEELLLNGKGLDITVGSGSFEAVLTSIVNKLIIQPKKFGSPMAQAANIGFTQMTNIYQGKDIVKMDESMSNLEPLKFYQEGDDYMEVYLPNYFKTLVDINNIDKRLLDLIGFRIPTQSPNSIERIRVKGFLPESYGNMIIVPAQITTKAGSDFDIDKLNLYFPNFTLDENGVPKYVEAFNNETEYKDNSEKLKAIDNGIHENYLIILDSKEYREQMLQPNSDERIKELCRNMKLANTEDGETSIFDMLGFNYHVSNKQGSQLGKNVLGQAALHSTDHIMSQVADIYLREQRPNFEGIEKVQEDANTTTLKTLRDIEGIRITDTISEMVNALVDVLKEPYIKYSGITEHNAATFFYMLRTGLTLKQVVHFFNHPFIRSYNRELAKRQFNSSVYNSTLHKNLVEEILNDFNNNQRTDENGNPIPNNQIIKITNTELEQRASQESAEYNNFDYSVIKEFDRLFNAANKLNEFMRVSKFDTVGVGTSFGETRGMKFDFDKFEKNNDLGNGKSYIENWNNKFERNGQKTTLGAYKDVVDESVDYFNSLYTANSYTNFKTSLDTLLASILGKNRVSMYSKYVSDFATYVTQNYGNFPSNLIKKSKGSGTVAQRIKAVLKGDNKVLKNNLFLNKLILDTSGEQHKLLLQGSASMNVYESEQLSTSFSELAYYDEHLANDIIKVGILQDGFSKSPYSFLQLVPIQYKLEQVQTYYSELAGVNVQDFDTKFKINNYKKALNQYYPPKGREFNQPDNTYTLGKKEANGKRAIYIKVAGKTYTINEFGVVKDREEDVIIGRDSLDYRTSILGKATEVNATSEEFKNSFISNAERVKIQNCQ